VCGSVLSAPTEQLSGEAQCPRCQARLWFVNFPTAGTRFALRRDESTIWPVLAEAVKARDPELAQMLTGGLKDADSLDTVELMMNVDEAISGQ
jgi:hypothetical protein